MYRILVISVWDDSHLPYVQQHLNEEMLVIDTYTFPNTGKLTYDLTGSTLQIFYNEIPLEDICSVWFRKPAFLKRSEYPVSEEFKEYAHNAYITGVKLIYDLMPNKFWVSPYEHHMRANNKALQLNVARNIGFSVPETVITNNSEIAESFRRRFPSIIAKPLRFTPILLDNGDRVKAFYATSIAAGSSLNTKGLHLTPTIFQQEIKPKKDIRITIVGNDVFACTTTPTGSMENKADWRTGITTEQVIYETTTLPQMIIDLCKRFLRFFGLPFGVIELALDTNNNYWFLELNPNGQWAFVEKYTGAEISKSMAKMLEKGGF